jgi:hypothetical protein
MDGMVLECYESLAPRTNYALGCGSGIFLDAAPHPLNPARSIVTDMGLRRIIGSALAALLLVTAALPAFCGECRARKAEQGCAGTHDGTVAGQHERHASAAVMSADCDRCAEHREAAPDKISAGTKADEFSIMKTAHFFCGAVDRQVAAVSTVEGVTLQSEEASGINSDIPLIMLRDAGPIFRGNPSGAETAVANSAYEPLFVSLKI